MIFVFYTACSVCDFSTLFYITEIFLKKLKTSPEAWFLHILTKKVRKITEHFTPKETMIMKILWRWNWIQNTEETEKKTHIKSQKLVFQKNRLKMQTEIKPQRTKQHNSRYTNADMKIYQYLRYHIKIISRRFRIITPFTFWVIRIRDKWNVCLQIYRNNRIC